MLLALSPSASARAQLPRPTAPKTAEVLVSFYALKVSTPQTILFERFKPIIGELVVRKYFVDRFFSLY